MKKTLIYQIYLVFKSFFYYSLFVEKGGQGKIKVLVVNHYFDQDILALVRGSVNIEYIIITPEIFQPIRNIYPDIVKKGQIEYNHDSFERQRRWAYRFSSLLFRWLKFLYGIDLLVSPSDIFYWLREFIRFSKKQNISTIIIDKEGIISPYYFENHSKKIKKNFPLISDKILVWSSRQKRFWIECGTEPSKIEVLGQLRSDLFINQLKEKKNDYILFFTYFTDAYIPEELQQGGLSWNTLRAETHEVLKHIAEENKQVDILVKCHPQQRDVETIRNEFSQYKNVKVLTGAKSTYELMLNASLIIGFQSTAMIEACLLNKPTIYTFWTESVRSFEDGILPFHQFKSFTLAKSSEELYLYINSFIHDNKLAGIIEGQANDTESMGSVIDYYLFKPNGKVGSRVNEYIENFVLYEQY
ncbi:hypothetical protein [Carboxylicivirga sp. N1Y90]|uniref:hypothetical protein n=1 Tax=Carboxylicivirga fragile TaxID=3417571 RepID=UPI003D324D06|nr:hypothetical protein [Marinilabiliaceae bacterium N1Y90]